MRYPLAPRRQIVTTRSGDWRLNTMARTSFVLLAVAALSGPAFACGFAVFHSIGNLGGFLGPILLVRSGSDRQFRA